MTAAPVSSQKDHVPTTEARTLQQVRAFYLIQVSIADTVLAWGLMDTQSIVDALDREIERLKQARAILETLPNATTAKRSPGRPKGSTATDGRKKRVMSDEARARISAAQQKRWAAKNKEK